MAAGVFLGVAGILDSREPVYWGTFTEERCVEGGRRGCQSVGMWVSDDGTIRVVDVQLDGGVDADGTADASYQPTGIHNDADNNVVHTPMSTFLEPVVPWILVLGGAGASALYWRRWRGTWR